MFRVYFLDTASCQVVVFCSDRLESAIEFSLALHRSSNVFHTVRVVEQVDDDVVDTRLELSLLEPKDE